MTEISDSGENRRNFLTRLVRLACGTTAAGITLNVAPLRRLNRVQLQQTAYASTCGAQDICTTRDNCGQADTAGHTCTEKDICDVDASADCTRDECTADSSGRCTDDYAGCSDDSIQCGEEDIIGTDESGACTGDQCRVDKSAECTNDTCSTDASESCFAADQCVSDSSAECTTSDDCVADSSWACSTNDSCTSDKSGDCGTDSCVSDKSGGCLAQDQCSSDSSGACTTFDYCSSDSSGDCNTHDSCESDSSKECIVNDSCISDSSGSCENDSCTSDGAGICSMNDDCVSDKSGNCSNDFCLSDKSGICLTKDQCLSDSSGICSTGDNCVSDSSGDCTNRDVCVSDESSECGSDLCREDKSENPCATTDTCALDLVSNPVTDRRTLAKAAVHRALKILYGLGCLVLALGATLPHKAFAGPIFTDSAVFLPEPAYEIGADVTVEGAVGPFLCDFDHDGILEADVDADGLDADDPEVKDYNGDGSRELPDGAAFAGAKAYTCFYIPTDVAIIATGPLTIEAVQEVAVFGAMRVPYGITLRATAYIDLRTSAWLGPDGAELNFITSLSTGGPSTLPKPEDYTSVCRCGKPRLNPGILLLLE